MGKIVAALATGRDEAHNATTTFAPHASTRMVNRVSNQISKRPPLPANQRGLLSSADAAQYLSISESTFFRIIASKDSIIKPLRIGESVRYRLSDLNDYIDALPQKQGTFQRTTND
jgi:predicted DNA-binding transcriptional regulator AlpA